MPRSGCSALHGVNPNLKKKKKALIYFIGRCAIGITNNYLYTNKHITSTC